MSVNTWSEIDLNAILLNFRRIKAFTGSGVCVAPVVKSQAYGHGAYEVARVLSKSGVHFFAVNNVEEAIEVRNEGITADILVMGGILPCDLDSIIEYNLIPTIHSLDMAECLSDKSRKRKLISNVHVKIDTGMARLGIFYDNARQALDRIQKLSHIKIVGIYTHFATADQKDRSFFYEQMKRFERVCKHISRDELFYVHACNSAAIMDFPNFHYNMVRPGLAIYGYLPSESIENPLLLIPAMTVKSKILHIKNIPCGSPVSYGGTYVAGRDTLIGILPVGYNHGLYRCLSNKACVLVRGQRVPIIGRICMDQSVIDLTDIPGVSPGDEAVLLGKQGTEVITADEIANCAGTISYEILCGFGAKIPRVYKWKEENGQAVDVYKYLKSREPRVGTKSEDSLRGWHRANGNLTK